MSQLIGQGTGPVNEVGQPKYLTRSPLPSANWQTFFDVVNKAFQVHLISQGPPGQKAPKFLSDYPKDNNGHFDSSFDVILYHTAGSKMAPMDNAGGRVPKGPQRREIKPHPTKARYNLVTIGWWELLTAKFTIYSLSHDRADELVMWFHRMMMRYTFQLDFFRARGVQDLRFIEREADEFSTKFDQELYIRSLTYSARLELLDSYEFKDLESIALTIGGPPNPQTTIDLVEQYPIPNP